MVAYTYQMPSGIPGAITRPEQSTVEQVMLDLTNLFPAFGLPGKIDPTSSKLNPIASGDVASSIYGFLVRTYPTSGNGTDGLGVATPNTKFPADVLKRGYINVTLNNTSPAVKNGRVYVRVANGATGTPIGGVEASALATVSGGVIDGTGTGTIAATVTDQTLIVPGKYTITLQTTSNTSALTVIDPKGNRLPDGVVGTAYNQGGLGFTITAAGTMTRGDFFQPVVSSDLIVVGDINTYFTGPADASANAEIAFNI